MRDNFNLLTVQGALGYTFKDADLIKTAFVHRSFEGAQSNIKLSFVGEKLVEFIISDYLFSHGSSVGEKQLEHSFKSYVEALKPEKFILDKKLDVFIKLSSLNESIRSGKAVCREVFFAVCAAIYKDGGLPALKSLIMPMIRSLDKGEHYAPSIEGKVINAEEKTPDTDKHIKSARVKPSKNGIGFSRAETVNTEPAQKKSEETPPKVKPKKSSAISKLLGKKEAKSEQKQEIKEQTEDTAPKKRFIRDALEPVRLSDDLRNFKPKKPKKSYDDPAKEQVILEIKPVPKAPEKELPPVNVSDDENYKSLLQELVQKNIRTANVLIQYKTKSVGKAKWRSEVIFMDKVLGHGEGEGKKTAEKIAAEVAYKAISDKKSESGRWFASKRDAGAQVIEAPATDYVSKINQYFQKTQRLSSAPISYEKRHSSKKGFFRIAVVYEDKEIGIGEAKSPKEAKQNAAEQACMTLNIK